MAEYAAAAAVIVGVAISTYSAVQASEQQAQASDAIRKQREVEAQNAEESAAFEERQHRRRIALLAGKQAAIFSASGVDPSVGTPLEQAIDLATQGELEALSIKRAGATAAGASRFEAGIARYRRDVLRAGIPMQIAGGVFSAVGGGIGAYRAAQPRTVTTVLVNQQAHHGT